MGARVNRWATLGIIIAFTATGCSGGDNPAIVPPPTTPAGPSASPSAPPDPTATADPTATPKPPPNDLAGNRTTRTVRAGPVSIRVTYGTRLSVDRWKATGSKPLDVSLTASDGSSRSRKVYLSRLTMTMSVSDESGELPAPSPQVDAANISPGYLVTSPNTYSQAFVIPDLDDSAKSLTLNFRYELLLQQGPTIARDYSKQTATDTLRIPINAP